MKGQMTFKDVRWFGAFGSGISAVALLGMAIDDQGWTLAADLLFAAYWVWVLARFLRLKTITTDAGAIVFQINGNTIIDTRRSNQP